jgi:hypothetical protein
MTLGLSVLVVSTGLGAEPAAVQLIGRAERSAGVWQVTWPGVGWRTAFSGCRVGVATQDSVGYGVMIDGLKRNPIPPSDTRQTTWYRGLSAGDHTIEVIRMRGSPRTPGLFFGFSKGVDGRWLALPPRPTRQIEFIADSASTGYGDLSTSADCTDDEVASRYRGLDWHPQVAVVRIGSNDFGSPLGASEPWKPAQLETEFTGSYRNMLEELRGRLGPNGLIIVIQPAFDENPANRKVAEIVDSLRSGVTRNSMSCSFRSWS